MGVEKKVCGSPDSLVRFHVGDIVEDFIFSNNRHLPVPMRHLGVIVALQIETDEYIYNAPLVDLGYEKRLYNPDDLVVLASRVTPRSELAWDIFVSGIVKLAHMLARDRARVLAKLTHALEE